MSPLDGVTLGGPSQYSNATVQVNEAKTKALATTHRFHAALKLIFDRSSAAVITTDDRKKVESCDLCRRTSPPLWRHLAGDEGRDVTGSRD